MPSRMACSMTIPQVHAREKTETRRNPGSWKNLKAGDRLTLIERGMGLPKGAKQVVIAEVIVASAEIEPILALTPAGIRAEGFDPDEWTVEAWARWWADAHRMKGVPLEQVTCRRIVWDYLDGELIRCPNCDADAWRDRHQYPTTDVFVCERCHTATDPATGPLPGVIEPRFVRFTKGGKVHIFNGRTPSAIGVFGLDTALCRRRASDPLPRGVAAFNDTELCSRCYQSWPHDHAMLFEHAQR